MSLLNTTNQSRLFQVLIYFYNVILLEIYFKESYTYDHEKYDYYGQKHSADCFYNYAAVACDSSVGSAVGK